MNPVRRVLVTILVVADAGINDALVFAQSMGDWPAVPDATASLAKLKRLGLKLVVHANADHGSFEKYVPLLPLQAILHGRNVDGRVGRKSGSRLFRAHLTMCICPKMVSPPPFPG